jgi:predicted MFS family arabinose efflux permease
VAGLGVGLVNPPLASTAIGVVPPHQAGMASGVNSTFRQVGIAALGSVLTAAMLRNLSHAGPPPVPAARLVTAIRQGQTGQLLASLKPPRCALVTRPASTTC